MKTPKIFKHFYENNQAFTSLLLAMLNVCGMRIREINVSLTVEKNAIYQHGFIFLVKKMVNCVFQFVGKQMKNLFLSFYP